MTASSAPQVTCGTGIPRDLPPLFPDHDAVDDAAIAELCARYGFVWKR